MVTVSIEFFKQLFFKTFSIGTDAQRIANGQMIAESFAQTLLDENLSQFLAKIKNDGYSITADTPQTNIKHFVYYKTAAMLVIGYTTSIPDKSTLSEIIRMRDNFEMLAIQDVNRIVQQVPLAGGVVAPNRQSILP